MTAWPFYGVAEAAAVLVFGLILGSFSSALVWRVPRGLSWLSLDRGDGRRTVRSCCTLCGHRLGLADLVPILSWLFLKGKCRYCGGAVSARYPLIELTVLAGVGGACVFWGLSFQGLAVMAAVPFLVALLFIDAEHFILPDSLVAASAVAGLVFLSGSFVLPGADGAGIFLAHAGGAFLFAGVAWLAGQSVRLVLKKDSLGLGDVKFFAVAGLWLGAAWLAPYLILSGILGIAWGLGYKIIRKQALFPFGPALILSLYFCLLAQKAGFNGLFLP